jgi:hypothetical protein
MATLVCKNCKCPVMLDISANLKVIVAFGIASEYLTISLGEIEYRDSKNKEADPKFYCPECGSISEEDLLACCIYCGEYLSPDKIFRLLDENKLQIGGEYCTDCSDITKSHVKIVTKVPLTELIKKVRMDRPLEMF